MDVVALGGELTPTGVKRGGQRLLGKGRLTLLLLLLK